MRYQRCVLVLLLASFLLGLFIGVHWITHDQDTTEPRKPHSKHVLRADSVVPVAVAPQEDYNIGEHVDEEIDAVEVGQAMQDSDEDDMLDLDDFPQPSYDIHAFYYPWYGSPELDGRYIHWNHEYMQHWDSKQAGRWPQGTHQPPDDIGANFYPELGPYSSQDPAVIESHMQQIRAAAIGVIAVSWYPPGLADGQGQPIDTIIPIILDMAEKFKVKVCLHIEPYLGRSAASWRDNLQYIIKMYGSHPAFYRRLHKGKKLPLFYMYDSYLVKREDWARVFTPTGDLSVRGTQWDAIFVGLLVENKHKHDIVFGGFDGFYTYFASNGFTYGSKTTNWKNLAAEAQVKDLLFIPSVGPGYVDERVRPWNGVNTKSRNNGQYYETSMQAAVDSRPPIISITSFNEWHEGTQIEKAISKEITGAQKFKYMDYKPEEPDFYLSLTRKWVHKFTNLKKHEIS